MSDTVDIAWLRDRLVSVAALTDIQAGNLICRGMIEGELSAVAPHAVCRPERSARYHSDDDFSEEDYLIPAEYWSAVDVDWTDRRPYFRFFHQKRAWLVQHLIVPSKAAFAFVRANDPLLTTSDKPADPQLVAAKPAIGTKGTGGAPPIIDWERCLIEAARWMYVNGLPPSQAKLIDHIEDWLGDAAPGPTQLKTHLAPLYRAFRDADRER